MNAKDKRMASESIKCSLLWHLSLYVAFSFVQRCVTAWPRAGVNHGSPDLKNKTRLELQTSKYSDVGVQRGWRDPEEEGEALTASSSSGVRGEERKTAANAV